MFEIVYETIGCLEILIFLILIRKYIYLEKGFESTKGWRLFFGLFVLSQILGIVLDKSDEFNIFITFLFFIGYSFVTRPRNKIRAIFLVIPITGMMLSVIMVPYSIVYLFSDSMETIINANTTTWVWVDVAFWFVLIWFIIKGKTWRVKFNQVARYRVLARWERNLLNGTGMLLFLFFMLVVCIDSLGVPSAYAKGFVVSGMIAVVLLETAIVAMVMQGNHKMYFQNLAIVNEHYLKTQLEHFKTYQQTQIQTRRIRHDMKNHIACLYQLMQQQNFNEAKKYIAALNEQVEHIDHELHTGNDIVDAIVNEKRTLATQYNIHIVVDGQMGSLQVEAIELCTIFSNALDNAIEALMSSSIKTKEIQIDFKTKNLMQFIMFRNPIESGQYNEGLHSTKGDPIHHGFGLDNINLAVKKYNGQMACRVEEEAGQQYFVLEIILFFNEISH
jgi:hypothetical protein